MQALPPTSYENRAGYKFPGLTLWDVVSMYLSGAFGECAEGYFSPVFLLSLFA